MNDLIQGIARCRVKPSTASTGRSTVWNGSWEQKDSVRMVDHGSEFPDSATLEQSVLGNQPRTIIYDAYPNRSWKRGSNENGNGFIRYFIPKGHHNRR